MSTSGQSGFNVKVLFTVLSFPQVSFILIEIGISTESGGQFESGSFMSLSQYVPSACTLKVILTCSLVSRESIVH